MALKPQNPLESPIDLLKHRFLDPSPQCSNPVAQECMCECSVTKSCPTLCNPMNCSPPGSSTLAWKIPWREEPGRLQSMESLGVGHDWATSFSLFTFYFHALEKEMATHSSVLAWRIPGTGEPGRLLSIKHLSSSSKPITWGFPGGASGKELAG